MEISYIKDFVVLAEVCNYNKASEDLFISRSTLFSHIKALESEFNVALFIRRGKRIELSDYGRKFLPYARRIIDEFNEYLRIVQDDKDDQTAVIRIGLQYRVQELIRDFRQVYRNYNVYTFSICDSNQTLIDGSSDLAFVRNVSDPDNKYETIPFVKDYVVAALYSTHPMANRSRISLFELRNEDFIMITKDNMAINLCEEVGFFPRIVMTTESANAAAALVDWGMGITLFLKESIKFQNTSNMVLIDLDPPVECNISLCWNKDKKLSESEKMFIEFAKNYYND